MWMWSEGVGLLLLLCPAASLYITYGFEPLEDSRGGPASPSPALVG